MNEEQVQKYINKVKGLSEEKLAHRLWKKNKELKDLQKEAQPIQQKAQIITAALEGTLPQTEEVKRVPKNKVKAKIKKVK